MGTNTEQPSIEAIKALDGKIFAMLTPEEEATLNFYRDRGRGQPGRIGEGSLKAPG